MSRATQAYLAAVITAGVCLLFSILSEWQPQSWSPAGWYLVLAVAASTLKVTLPGVQGVISISSTFTLIAIMSLGYAEALIIGCCGTLVQSIFRAKHKPKPVQVAFNIAATALGVAGAWNAFQTPWIHGLTSTAALPLIAAAMTYQILNTAMVSAILALTTGKRFWNIWVDNFFFSLPQNLICASVALIVHLVGIKYTWELMLFLVPALYAVYRSYQVYLRRLQEEKDRVSATAELQLKTIRALAVAIDAKDHGGQAHLHRLRVFSLALGKDLGLSESDLHALEAAAILHDIGKLAVPDYIISKPGRLTTEEFDKMKIHTVVGAEILESVEFPYPVVPIVRSHHERWDGKGYPDGLAGEQIPMGARILAAIDCLDALASERPYRASLSLDDAMAYIVSESGASFDPKVVEALRSRYKELEEKFRAAPVVGRDVGRPATDTQPELPDFTQAIAAARNELQILLELTRDLGNSLSVEDTFSLLASRLQSTIPHDALVFYTKGAVTVDPAFVSGLDAELFQSLKIPLGHGISGWVVENGKPLLNGNPSSEPGYLDDPSKFTRLRSAVSIPLEGSSGVLGCLTLYSLRPDAFNRDHLRLLLAISTKSGLTIENALKFRQEQQTASMDGLTGLPNARSLLLELDHRLREAAGSGEAIAVLVLDLDGFKQVNDQYGHLEGNRLLKMISDGLKEHCRKGADYVARLGGDEFVVVIKEAPQETIRRRVEDLRSMVQSCGRIVTNRDFVNLSVGTAVFPQDGRKAEDLLAKADAGMYEMKALSKQKRGQVQSALLHLSSQVSAADKDAPVPAPPVSHS